MELDDILGGNPATSEERAQSDRLNQPRDDHGKFAKGDTAEADKAIDKSEKTKEIVETASSDTAPPADQESVPSPRESAFLAKANDEKAKRQAAEKRYEDALRRQRELEARIQKFESPAPDPDLDPEGHINHVRQEEQQRAFNDKLNISEEYARERHGDDVVTEATQAFLDAASSDPLLRSKLQTEKDPYGYVVKWHKREKFLAEVGDDPEEWKARVLSQPQERRPEPPPRSLASASSARGSSAVAPEVQPLSNILGR